MGFASGMSAGSAAAQRAVDAFTNSRDRMDRANRQKKVDDLSAQLERDQVETGLQAPTAQFGVTDGPAPRMAGLSLGQQAPTGDITVGSMSGAPTATGLDVSVPLAKGSRKRSRAETEGLLGQIALAKGDHSGYATSLDRVRVAEMGQLDDEVAKTPLADIEGLLTQTNTNQSNLPVLYTGKDKNGYEVTLLGDGSEPGGKFKLNEAQLRGLYRAQKLAEAGYGAESLAAMTGAHKEIGEHIARYNGLVSQNVQGSNTAMRYGNQDKHNADTLASQEAYRKEQGRLGWAKLQQDGAHQAAVRGGIRAQGRQYQVEDGNGRRGLFTPTRFDKDGLALLPDGYRYVTEDGQGGRGGADAGLKVNSDGSVIQNGVLYVPGSDGTYKPAKGLGPSALDKALGALKAGGGVPAPERGMPFIGEPSPGFRFASQKEMRSQPAVNPDNLERVSKRGMFGGVNYEYLDRATGKSYSVDEYNQMLSN